MDVVFYGNGKLNPGKPELNIDPPAAERMKICGITSLCLFYLNRSFGHEALDG